LRVMPTVTLKAHYDGERIQLDEPFDLPRNALLLVTVLSQRGTVIELPGLPQAAPHWRGHLVTTSPSTPRPTSGDEGGRRGPHAAAASGWADQESPSLILREMPPYGDLLVCGVSTQLHQEAAGFDDPIRPGDADFAASGLKAPSLIR